jgi:HD superfamily phosphodiesterase
MTPKDKDKVYQIVKKACYHPNNHFGSGIWEFHILNVIKHAKNLARRSGANSEIVELAALLHDYAGIKNYQHYAQHHIQGAKEAKRILKKLGYSEETISEVQDCILNHRGSKPGTITTKETRCLVDADGMAHFDSIASLLSYQYANQHVDIQQGINWLMAKLSRTWKKLSPSARKLVKNRYNACKLLFPLK